MNSVVFIFSTCRFSGVYKITIIIFIPNISSKKCELANIYTKIKWQNTTILQYSFFNIHFYHGR